MTIAFLDESGFMLQPVVSRTWAPRGQTPVLKSWDRHDRLTVTTVLSLKPKALKLDLLFNVQRENANTESFLALLDALAKRVRGRILLVLDRLSAHRGAAKIMTALRPGKFEFVWLPAYAPQLNPVEFIWARTKRGKLANFIPKDLAHLESRVSDCLQNTEADIIRGAFKHAGLAL